MKNLFKRNGLVLILISLMLFYTLPQLLCAFMMLITDYFLTDFSIIMINTITYLIVYILFSLGLSRFIDNKCRFTNIINCLPIVIGYGIILILNHILGIYGLDNILWINIIHLFVNGIIIVLSILISIEIIKNKKININFINILKLVLFIILIYIIPNVISSLLGLLLGENVFVGSLLLGLLQSLLVSLFVVIFVNCVEKSINIDGKKISKILLIIISIIIIIVTFILNVINNKDDVKTVDDMISYSLASGDYAFDEMDIIVAKEFYTLGEDIKCAYSYAVDNTYDTKNCNGELLSLFKDLNKEESLELIKDKINNKNANMYDIEALTKLMKDKNDPEIGKMIKYLISQMKFTRTTVLPFDLNEKEKEELKKKLENYNKHIIVRKYIDTYVEWLNEGEINSTVISKASQNARNYPEELSLQANAIKFYLSSGDNLSGDSIVVDNFVKLTKDSMNDKSEEEIIAYKTYIVLAYQACNSDRKVISFLEEYKPNIISVDLGTMLLKSYKNNRNHEKAYEMALNILNKDEYNVEALSYLSIYTLQSDIDKSLEYAKKLSKVIADKKENYLGADIALGLYRVYLTGYYESPDSTFCPYQNFYRDMTEEQKSIIKNDEILNAYLNGYGANEDGIKVVNSVLSKYDYISYLYYYKGVYEVNHKDYKNAVDDLKKAIILGNKNPFFYSELGFAYEGIGDLKNSLISFEEASRIIDEYNLGGITYNFASINSYFNVYINNAKHAMYESEGDH